MSDNYYEILKASSSSLDELKEAYKRETLKCHPDRAAINNLTVEESTTKFQKLQNAYDKLKDQLENPNAYAQQNSPDTNSNFWTEPISPEERIRTGEEAIRLIQVHFDSFGVTEDELEKDWVLGFYTDWKTMMRDCFNRGEFKLKYDLMLDAIERIAKRKKENEDFHHQTNGKEEKFNESRNWKKGTKREFATQEEADEYYKRKHAEYEASRTGRDEKNPDRKNNSSNYSEPETNSSSPPQEQENGSTESPNSESKNNPLDLNKDKQKAEVSNDRSDNLLDLVLPKERQEKENELKELKNEIAKLQKQQSSFQDKIINQQSSNVNNTQSPQKEFNWLYVVIPMGVVIIGLFVLLLRKEKK